MDGNESLNSVPEGEKKINSFGKMIFFPPFQKEDNMYDIKKACQRFYPNCQTSNFLREYDLWFFSIANSFQIELVGKMKENENFKRLKITRPKGFSDNGPAFPLE